MLKSTGISSNLNYLISDLWRLPISSRDLPGSDIFSCVPVNSPLDSEIPNNRSNSISHSSASAQRNGASPFTLVIFYTKKILAERSGWHREEKSFPVNPLSPPPCITWVQGGADTGGSVAQPRRFTLHTPLEVLLTGDAGQILNICHGSELLRDVLTVRIATSCTRSWNLNQGSWNFNFVQSYLADWNGGRCSLWNFPQESWEAQNHHPQESCRGRKG